MDPVLNSEVLAELVDLREQVARYRAAFVLSAPGRAMLDLSGRFVEVNTSLCHILGYTARVLLKLRFMDITHPYDIALDAQCVADMTAGKVPQIRRIRR